MKKKLLLLMLVFISALNAQQFKSENLFYLVDRSDSFESFKENSDQISIVAPQVYRLNEEGVVWGNVDSRVLKIAKEKNIKVMPLIVNPGFNLDLFHKFLHNEEARRRAIEMMVKIAEENNFYGWQFDFENIHISDREIFTQFYRETAEALHAKGFALSAAIVPRDKDHGGASNFNRFLFEFWQGAFDLKALAEIGDFISLMTYSQHTRRTQPGPVAGLKWFQAMIDYTLAQGVPPEKISLGIPFFSHHWYAAYDNERGGYATGTGIPYKEAANLMERFNAEPVWIEDQGCAFAFYENDGLFEYLFLEDARSFEIKLKKVSEYNFRGISVWRIGQEDPAMWDVLERLTEKK